MSKMVETWGAGWHLRYGSLSLFDMVFMFIFIFNFLTIKIVIFHLFFFSTFYRISPAVICASQFIQLNSCSITLSTVTRVVSIGMSSRHVEWWINYVTLLFPSPQFTSMLSTLE